MKPGVKTSEFWASLGTALSGVALCMTGDFANGINLVMAAVSAYVVSRGIAKHGSP